MLIMALIVGYNLFSSPYFGIRKSYKYDLFNLDKNTEKKFRNDDRFNIPLRAFVLCHTIGWIWSLVVCSDKVKFNNIWFNPDISTPFKYFSFSFLWSLMTAICGNAGHELLHKKEWFDKYLGAWCYTMFFDTHFLYEHIEGHHKDIATYEDPGTARYNENFYAFTCRAIYSTHVNTW